MREFSVSINISSPAERVWNVLADVEHWPEWTPSVLRIEPISGTPLGAGSQVRVHQPKLRPAVWKITRWEPGCRFDWMAKHPGVTIVAEHAIASNPNGCNVTLNLRFNGLLGSLLGRLSQNLATRNLDLEATGLKERSEGRI
jgi:Polyketide cyclase / dehydrase and lipid transport